MTALSNDSQRERGESLGVDRYLVKSQVGIEDVVNTIHELLGDKAQNAPVAPTDQPAAPAPAATPNVPLPPLTPEIVSPTTSSETASLNEQGIVSGDSPGLANSTKKVIQPISPEMTMQNTEPTATASGLAQPIAAPLGTTTPTPTETETVPSASDLSAPDPNTNLPDSSPATPEPYPVETNPNPAPPPTPPPMTFGSGMLTTPSQTIGSSQSFGGEIKPPDA
jgi:hypothetical protein